MTLVHPSTIRTFRHERFDPSSLAARKAGQLVSVCLPARNEESTVGSIVATIQRELVDRAGLVDEILVIDDHSTDATAEVAAASGAKVFAAEELLADYGEGHGKGEAMWKSVHAASGDLIVWCDADIRDFPAHFVTGLLGPLVEHPDIAFVKGFYERPGADGVERGGRVTELVARPLLSLFFPELTDIVQPLAGEFGGRREVLEQLPFVQGYGVDLGLLIDVAAQHGPTAIAQVDLGRRVHRNRPLDELSPQALAVLQAALQRAVPGLTPEHVALLRPGSDPVVVDVVTRPALVTVPEYRARHLGA